MFTIPAQAVSQGTDGDELQVLEASELEIQLGTAWAGVGFVFRTDAGVYPSPVYVGNDGVLRLEIGGSKQYILSCLQSDIPIPEPVLIQMQAFGPMTTIRITVSRQPTIPPAISISLL